MNGIRFRLTCMLALVLGALGAGGCGHNAASSEAPPVSLAAGQQKASPNFSLVDYAGKRHQLSEFRGKPVLLNFWASWCGPCRQEMPELAQSAQLYQDQIQFVGINLAERDAPSVSRDLLERNKISYPNLLDTEGSVANAFGIMVIPTSFLLDSQGQVVEKIQGPLTQQQIGKLLQKVK